MQSSELDSIPPIEKGVDPFCRKEADGGPCRLTQSRSNRCSSPAKGPSIRPQPTNIDNHGRVKRYRPRQSRHKDNESDSLSDIDDAEVIGYLNNKEEMNYKRILWEAMNRNYNAAKKQKQTIGTKKGASAKKAVKTARKVEIQRPSSRINYDALKNLNDKWSSDSEAAQITRTESDTHKANESPNGNITPEMHGYEGSNCDEDQHDTSKDNEAFGHHSDHMHIKEYGDENFDDEYFGDENFDDEYFEF